MEAEKCSNCGAVELKEIGGGRLKCAYCAAVMTRAKKHHGVEVRIAKNAHVTVLPTAHLVIRNTVTDFDVGEGADVKIAGEIVMEAPGDPKKRRRE